MKIVFVLFFLLSSGNFLAQQLFSGVVYDENNIPIPQAKLYVKNADDFRTIADLNGYFEMRLMPGEYYVIITFTGYENQEYYLPMADLPIKHDIHLVPTKIQDIYDIEVSAKKSNPGRDIMLEVVKRREQINPWNYPHKVEVYTRATEQISQDQKSKEKETEDAANKTEKETKKEEKKKEKPTENSEETEVDPFAAEKKAQEAELSKVTSSMNLVEVQLTRNYSPPRDVKELRNAYEVRGNKQNLYYTTTVKSNFNFFENLLHLDDLHETPVSSPISGPGILSYKYRLEEQYEENGQKISKIRIIARNTATTTLSGTIWVIDSIWMIQKLELTMEKGNLHMYDHFTVYQEYDNYGDTLNVLTNQKLTYGVKYKNDVSECVTNSQFRSYNFQPNFPAKFFNNEVSVTEQEAFDKDTTFWNTQRGFALTDQEQRYIFVKDSIEIAHNKKEYLDSVDQIFNKVTALKVLWFGVDHRNRTNKTQWSINSVAAFVRPLYIAGPRLAPGFNYFKKWKNEKYFDGYAEITFGLLNKDVKGNINGSYRYDPFHFGNISANFGHDFDVIRSYDAITQIYKRSNFIETTSLSVDHFRELFNGFYSDINFTFAERRSVDQYKFVKLLDKAVPNQDPNEFQTYQALVGVFTLSYTPGQKFMREPNRKVRLGSKWPSIYATYERGIPKLFGSDINHEYLLGGITQTFKIGTIGTSSYHIKSGQFLSAKALYDADFKFHRRSDPFWFSNPLYSFQDLDSSLPSRKIFYEGHIVHHDNGAILNKIPFMKKTGIGLVMGAGILYVKEFDWLHYEVLAGLERNFKFSKRKLRVGIYGALSDGNHISPQATWKVSFAVLNLRDMKYNF
ncbi:MAG: DUF5686 family protein [Crocinitomicaceae bacterium]